MSKNGKLKVGIIGSQFEADIHAASLKIASAEAEVAAVASPTPGNAAALAKRYGIPRVFTDYREMLKERDIEMITIAAPNKLHAQMTADCAQAGNTVWFTVGACTAYTTGTVPEFSGAEEVDLVAPGSC